MQKVDYLHMKHTQLEKMIEQEENMLTPDETIITELKLKKLSIKDEIVEIENEGT